MRQSKFTETQIVSILKEADAGRPVNEIWRTYSVNDHLKFPPVRSCEIPPSR